MKKFLLSLACVAASAMMASAETVTFDVSGDNGYGMTLLSGSSQEYNDSITVLTEGAVTITLHGNTRWWANSKGNQLRFYKGSGMTVTAGGADITKVEFTPNNIQLGGEGFASGVWTGSAAEVALDATNTSGNTYCNKIAVTYGEGGGETPEPEVTVVESLSSFSDFPDGEAFQMGADLTVIYANGAYTYATDGQSNILIYKSGLGLAAGNVIAAGWKGTVKFYNGLLELVPADATLATTGATGTVPAPMPVEGEDAQWVVAAYNQGAYVKLLNVVFDAATPVSTGTFTGKMGDFEVTFYQRFGLPSYAAGTYDVTGFVAVYGDLVQVYPTAIEGESGDVDLPVIENLISLIDFPNNEAFQMGIDLNVIYANGAYTYVTDGNTNGLIYKSGLGLEAGNVIAKGWKGNVSIYNGLLELVPADATLATTGNAATVPAPVPVEAEDVSYMIAGYNQSLYVKLLNVTFEAATPAADAQGADRTYIGKMGENEVTFYQRFGLESVEAGTYDVTGFIAVYNDLVQVYPVAIEIPGGAVEPELPVIENIISLSDFPDKEAFEMGVDLTVIYANGSYVYVNDGLSNGLIYKNGLGLEAGNVIAKGWKGKVSIYNGLLEMVPDDDTLATTGAAGVVPEPTPVEGEDAQWMVASYNQSAYLKLQNVVFENATPAADAAGAARTYTGKMGDFEVTFYQRFGLESVEAGTYDVTGFVAVYNDQVQVYPIAIQAAGEVEPEIPVIENIIVLGDFPDKEPFEMGVDLTVIYANGSYVYVTDGLSNGLIYKNGLGLEAGNVIAKGWKGKVSIYNGLLEMVPDEAALATTGEAGVVPSPVPVAGEDAQWVVAAYNQHAYLMLEEVVFETATPAANASGAARTYTGKMGDFEVTFYQRFGLDSYEAGTYNVTGFVAVYNDQVQVYPILIQKSTGISAIANDDADARYYNINGVEVSNPAQGGLYIRVAGGKASKVIK